MLSAQQLVLYYMYAVHDMGLKNLPRLCSGSSIFSEVPCVLSGYECFWVYEWTKHHNWKQDFWAETRLPSYKTFERLLATYKISKRDNWPTVQRKLPSSAKAHMLSVRRHCNEVIDEIRAQLIRYRADKTAARKTNLKAQKLVSTNPLKVSNQSVNQL